MDECKHRFKISARYKVLLFGEQIPIICTTCGCAFKVKIESHNRIVKKYLVLFCVLVVARLFLIDIIPLPVLKYVFSPVIILLVWIGSLYTFHGFHKIELYEVKLVGDIWVPK